MRDFRGYMVVQVVSEMPGYKGVYRMPPYPSSHPEEAEAMDQYVFGDFKDEMQNDLIADLQSARKLLEMFRDKPTSYELIFVSNGDEEPEGIQADAFGYDVANAGGEWWSPVSEFPRRPNFQAFRDKLNQAGLFSQREDAQAFL